MRSFKTVSLSTFPTRNPGSLTLTVVTTPYGTSPECIYFMTGKLYLLTPHLLCPPLPPTSGNHQSVPWVYDFHSCFGFFRFHT